MPLTVLIVDDHPTFRRLVRRLLEDAGFVVVGEAHDAASALRGVRELAPEVLLLDVLLPDRSGLDVAAELGGSPCRPCIVLTSSRTRADLGVGVERSGADGFIAKGELTAAALRAVVSSA